MNLFEYFKALTISKNPMENPILISEDETRHLASIKYNMIAPRFSWSIPHMTDARGLILDTETGDVVARPYPKFFNYGQPEAGEWPDDTNGMSVQEKLDGSLVIVTTHKDELLFASSGSVTSEHSEIFEAYFKEHLSEEQLARFTTLGETYTMMFEYVSPDNKVVIQYEEPNMIMHGAIVTEQSDDIIKELPYDELKAISAEIGVDVIKEYPMETFNDISEYLDTDPGIEGFVVKFPNGHRVKFKTEEYVRLHNIATGLDLSVDSKKLRESLVISVVNQTHDDIIPFLSDETRGVLDEIVESYTEFIDEAGSKHAAHMKEVQNRATEIPASHDAIRDEIRNYAEVVTSRANEMADNLVDYAETQNDEDLLQKGYSQMVQLSNVHIKATKQDQMKFLKDAGEQGLPNTIALDNQEKRIVATAATGTILEKHIKSVLLSGNLEAPAEAYLTAVHVKDVELSEKQKLHGKVKQTRSIITALERMDRNNPEVIKMVETLQSLYQDDWDALNNPAEDAAQSLANTITLDEPSQGMSI